MVSQKSIEKQLKKLDFNPRGWNRSEVAELHNVILADEEIYELVNCIYEGGFALLIASDIRVLLVDKKPFGFLNVEDLRFDMINEIDYNHRVVGASITITTGSKTLNVRSYNKERLRKLIGHVQHCMADNKKKEVTQAEDQKQHLQKINEQLQAYLMTQYQQQQKLQEHLTKLQTNAPLPDLPQLEPAKMSDQLKDFLYANGLLQKYQAENGQTALAAVQPPAPSVPAAKAAEPVAPPVHQDNQLAEIYAEGLQEVFSKHPQPSAPQDQGGVGGMEVSPFRIAYSKLPVAWRNRKFGLSMPSLPHLPPSQAPNEQQAEPAPY